MIELKINEASCIKCGHCVAICPSKIFEQKEKESSIIIKNEQNCIVCGHCVGVCPTGSVIHGDFPAEKVHKIDYSALPTAEQVLLLCQKRRSNRSFTKKQIPEKTIQMILSAAHLAPTASNAQGISFTIVSNEEELSWVRNYTVSSFEKIYKMLNNFLVRPLLKVFSPKMYSYLPRFARLIKEHKKGNDIILRGASTLLLIHTPSDSRFGRDDANLAYQNASLMAESLGVSQVYMGFVMTAVRRDKHHSFEQHFGIKGTVQSIMALGMPAFRFENTIDKKDISVSYK